MNDKKRLGAIVRKCATVENNTDVNERKLAEQIVNNVIKRKTRSQQCRVIQILSSEAEADNLKRVEGELRVVVPDSMSVNVLVHELRKQLDNTYMGHCISIIVETEKKSEDVHYGTGMHRRSLRDVRKKMQRRKEKGNDDGSGTGGRHGKR